MDEFWVFFSRKKNDYGWGFIVKFAFLWKNCKFTKPLFSSTSLAIVPPRFSPPLKVSCFIVLFARVRRKHLEFPIEIQNSAPKDVFFAFSLWFYNGFKKHCKTPVKVPEMLPKPSFLHTVSAENRFFESAFEKTSFSRYRLQKLRNLLFFQRFYSITFWRKSSFAQW